MRSSWGQPEVNRHRPTSFWKFSRIVIIMRGTAQAVAFRVWQCTSACFEGLADKARHVMLFHLNLRHEGLQYGG